MVAVVFSGGALADVSVTGLTVTVRRADGRAVTAEVTHATQISCEGRGRCDVSAVRRGAVVVRADLRRGPGGVRFFHRLELSDD